MQVLPWHREQPPSERAAITPQDGGLAYGMDRELPPARMPRSSEPCGLAGHHGRLPMSSDRLAAAWLSRRAGRILGRPAG